MTIKFYDQDALESLFFRVFDVASTIRGMSEKARRAGLASVALNDKKALDWLSRLEAWTTKAEVQLRIQVAQKEGEDEAERHA